MPVVRPSRDRITQPRKPKYVKVEIGDEKTKLVRLDKGPHVLIDGSHIDVLVPFVAEEVSVWGYKYPANKKGPCWQEKGIRLIPEQPEPVDSVDCGATEAVKQEELPLARLHRPNWLQRVFASIAAFLQ